MGSLTSASSRRRCRAAAQAHDFGRPGTLLVMSHDSLHALEITNRCVVVCELGRWSAPDAAAWTTLNGTQDEVGHSLAQLLTAEGIRRIDDFGGVCETFLCDGDAYLVAPPQIAGTAAVFSFTPKKRIAAEGLEMARVATQAGYRLLILTVQKHKKFGKVWVIQGILGHMSGAPLEYYEDTNTVIDELKTGPGAEKIRAVHVQAPGYEHCVSRFADRVVTQEEYQAGVLA